MEVSKNDDDVYDKLGEALWGSILSLLPLLEAVRTSILSRKWVKVWTSIPSLDINIPMMKKLGAVHSFDDRSNTLIFTQIVVKILSQHESPIESFSIDKSYLQCKHSDMDRWIHTLIERRIGHMFISSSMNYDGSSPMKYEVPFFLFASKTIREIELDGFKLKRLPPYQVHCKNLKTVKLSHTDIRAGALGNLLSQCTGLETLALNECNVDVVNLEIAVRHLKRLEISAKVSNFKVSDFNSTFKKLRIVTPHLKYLNFGNLVFVDDVEIDEPELEEFRCYLICCTLWITTKEYENLRTKAAKIKML